MPGITDADRIEAASRAWDISFQKLFEQSTPGLWSRFSRVMPADVLKTTLAFLGAMPTVRKWEGEKWRQAMRAYSYDITLAKYESTFELFRMAVRYDSTGAVAQRIAAFFQAIVDEFYDGPATAILTTNPNGYDGVALFSASHPHMNGGAGASNYGTAALGFGAYEAAKIGIEELTDENSKPMKLAPKVLMVGPYNRKLGMEITGSKDRVLSVANDGLEAGTRVAAAAVTNVFGGGEVELVVNPRLVGTSRKYWFLFSDPTLVVPVAIAEGRKPEQHNQFNMDSPERFTHDKLLGSVEADLGFGVGMWAGSHGSLAT